VRSDRFVVAGVCAHALLERAELVGVEMSSRSTAQRAPVLDVERDLLLARLELAPPPSDRGLTVGRSSRALSGGRRVGSRMEQFEQIRKGS
jgi:hypothetical protein